MIEVKPLDENDPRRFRFAVSEGGGRTVHEVTMSEATYGKLSGGRAGPDEVIRASFRFLLDREPKEAILSRFDVTVISRYFPSFERDLPDYLGRGD
jgi:hypothetical protein